MRLRSIADIAASSLPDRIRGESCYLQLRLSVECFALGLVIAQGDFETQAAFTDQYSPIEIFKALEISYPSFFPVPSVPRKTGEGQWHFDDIGFGDCMTRKELEKLWGRSGDYLHRASLKKYVRQVPAAPYQPIHTATERFWNLVRSHRILLADHSTFLQVELGRDDDSMRCFLITINKTEGTAHIEQFNIELEKPKRT